jgi:hypothetical protein
MRKLWVVPLPHGPRIRVRIGYAKGSMEERFQGSLHTLRRNESHGSSLTGMLDKEMK